MQCNVSRPSREEIGYTQWPTIMRGLAQAYLRNMARPGCMQFIEGLTYILAYLVNERVYSPIMGSTRGIRTLFTSLGEVSYIGPETDHNARHWSSGSHTPSVTTGVRERCWNAKATLHPLTCAIESVFVQPAKKFGAA